MIKKIKEHDQKLKGYKEENFVYIKRDLELKVKSFENRKDEIRLLEKYNGFKKRPS